MILLFIFKGGGSFQLCFGIWGSPVIVGLLTISACWLGLNTGNLVLLGLSGLKDPFHNSWDFTSAVIWQYLQKPDFPRDYIWGIEHSVQEFCSFLGAQISMKQGTFSALAAWIPERNNLFSTTKRGHRTQREWSLLRPQYNLFNIYSPETFLVVGKTDSYIRTKHLETTKRTMVRHGENPILISWMKTAILHIQLVLIPILPLKGSSEMLRMQRHNEIYDH